MEISCFVIGPIGEKKSEIRKNADAVFKRLIQPVAAKFNIKPTRSDQIHQAGKLSDQMFEALFKSHLCIVDLAGRNPNVYYELALAQMSCKPLIILIPETETLPFDVKDFRTVPYDVNNFKEAAKLLKKFIQSYIDVNWKVDDLFSKYQQPKRISSEPVEFDLITGMEEKTTVYKIINLRVLKNGEEMIYEKIIPRLGRKIKVYSEVMATLINRYSQPVMNYKHNHRTDGDALELHGLLPFNLSLADNDPGDTKMSPVITGPSTVFVNQMHTYNGFTEDCLKLSTQCEKDVALVNFVVDMSSIPGYEKIVKPKPRLVHIFTNGNKKQEEKELSFEASGNGIFHISLNNLKKNEVLRFIFEPAT